MSSRHSRRHSRETSEVPAPLNSRKKRESSAAASTAPASSDEGEDVGRVSTRNRPASSSQRRRSSPERGRSSSRANSTPVSNGRRAKRGRASSSDAEEDVENREGRKRQRQRLVSYKERCLAALIEKKRLKEAELQRHGLNDAKRPISSNQDTKSLSTPHENHNQERGPRPPVHPSSATPTTSNGETADDDDTPPLILDDINNPLHNHNNASVNSINADSAMPGQQTPSLTSVSTRESKNPFMGRSGGSSGPPGRGAVSPLQPNRTIDMPLLPGDQLSPSRSSASLPSAHQSPLPQSAALIPPRPLYPPNPSTILPAHLQNMPREQIKYLVQAGHVTLTPSGQAVPNPQHNRHPPTPGHTPPSTNLLHPAYPHHPPAYLPQGDPSTQSQASAPAQATQQTPPSESMQHQQEPQSPPHVHPAPSIPPESTPPPPPQPPPSQPQQPSPRPPTTSPRRSRRAADLSSQPPAFEEQETTQQVTSQETPSSKNKQQRQAKTTRTRQPSPPKSQRPPAASAPLPSPKRPSPSRPDTQDSPPKVKQELSTPTLPAQAPLPSPSSASASTHPHPLPNPHSIVPPPQTPPGPPSSKMSPCLPPTTYNAHKEEPPSQPSLPLSSVTPLHSVKPPPPAPLSLVRVNRQPSPSPRVPPTTLFGGYYRRPGVLKRVKRTAIHLSDQPSEPEVQQLLDRREEIIRRLKGGATSSAVVNRPALLFAPRRKVHWDYLLEEMRWMATDFHEERKWKKAAANIVAMAAVAASQGGMGLARKEGEEVRRLADRVSGGCLPLWRCVLTQIVEVAKCGERVVEGPDLSGTVAVEGDGCTGLECDRITEEVERAAQVAEEGRTLARKRQEASVSIVQEMEPGKLYAHQRAALIFIQHCFDRRIGCLLSDPAASGKTVSVIHLLSQLSTVSSPPPPPTPNSCGPVSMDVDLPPSLPHLVILPTQALLRWRSELCIHAPHLSVCLVEEWEGREKDRKTTGNRMIVVLCPTEALEKEAERLQGTDWATLIVDMRRTEEGHLESAGGLGTEGIRWSRSIGGLVRKVARRLLLADGGEENSMRHAQKDVSDCLAFCLPSTFGMETNRVKAWVTETVGLKLTTGGGQDKPREMGAYEGPKEESPVVRKRVGEVLDRFRLRREQGEIAMAKGEDKVVLCECPARQAEVYSQIGLEAAREGTGEDAAAHTHRLLAARMSCLHADLASWYLSPTSLPNGPTPDSAQPTPTQPPPCPYPPPSPDPTTLPSSLTHAGKISTLLALLRDPPDAQRSSHLLLLASLPHAISLIQTFLTAADIPHMYALPILPNPSEQPSPLSPRLAGFFASQLTIARFNLMPVKAKEGRILLMSPECCGGEGALLPRGINRVVIVDQEGGEEQGNNVEKLIERLRGLGRRIEVDRLVLRGTCEEKVGEKERLWPGYREVGDARHAWQGQGREGRGKAVLSYVKHWLLQAAKTVGAESRLMERGVGEERQVGSLLTTAGGLEGGVEGEGTDGLLHQAMRDLVQAVPPQASNSQILAQHHVAMRAGGLESDLSVAAPPIPPGPGLIETIPFPSWTEDPIHLNLGLMLKYVSVVETVGAMARRRRGEVGRRLPGQRGEIVGPPGEVKREESKRPGPGVERRAGRTEMPTDWTTAEDEELIWAYETFGRNPVLLPFVLNKKTPPLVRKRSAKQCLNRVDALFNLGSHQGDARIPRPAHVIPSFRPRTLPIRDAVLEIPWLPLTALRRFNRQSVNEGQVPNILSPPNHDSITRLTRSFAELTKVQLRLKGRASLPDGPMAPSATTPETIPPAQPSSALNILDQMRKHGGSAGGLTGRSSSLLPLSPSPLAGPSTAPPPPATLVNVSFVNPSLTPPANAAPLGNMGQRAGGPRMGPRKAPLPLSMGGTPAGGAGGAGTQGGPGIGQRRVAMPSGGMMKRPIPGAPGPRGSGAIMGAPPALPVSGPSALSTNLGSPHARPTLPQGGMQPPAHTSPMPAPPYTSPGGSGGASSRRTGPSERPAASAPSAHVASAPPTTTAAAAAGAEPPIYAEQLLQYVSRHPRLSEQLRGIVRNTEVPESQRLQQIGEMLRDSNESARREAGGGPVGG